VDGFWSLDPNFLAKEPFHIPNIFLTTAITLLLLGGLRFAWSEEKAGMSFRSSWSSSPIPGLLRHTFQHGLSSPTGSIIVIMVRIACWSGETPGDEGGPARGTRRGHDASCSVGLMAQTAVTPLASFSRFDLPERWCSAKSWQWQSTHASGQSPCGDDRAGMAVVQQRSSWWSRGADGKRYVLAQIENIGTNVIWAEYSGVSSASAGATATLRFVWIS